MSSPAETHAEMEAERRTKERRRKAKSLLTGLYGLNSTTGFGSLRSDDWIEREIAGHLEAAMQLLVLEIHAGRGESDG